MPRCLECKHSKSGTDFDAVGGCLKKGAEKHSRYSLNRAGRCIFFKGTWWYNIKIASGWRDPWGKEKGEVW
jgi:hypothetical protein